MGNNIVVRGFTDRWKQKEKEQNPESLVSKIKNVGQPTVGLKEQIATVTQRLDAQTRNLDAAVIRFRIVTRKFWTHHKSNVPEGRSAGKHTGN